MSLFPHIWAIPLVLAIGAAAGWYLRSIIEESDSNAPPPPSILDDE